MTKINNLIGEENAKTVYKSVKECVENNNNNLDDVQKKNANFFKKGAPSVDLNDLNEITTQVVCEQILEESNKRMITKTHILNREKK